MRLGCLWIAPILLASNAFGAELSSPDGWKLAVPEGWKSAQDQGRYLFGSDTEAGLIVAWFAPGTTWESMRQAAASGVHEQGLVLSPKGEAKEQKLKGGRSLAVELTGADQAGNPLRARAVGVLGPNGSVGILGLTTEPQYANLKKRVDAMAASVRFEKPKPGAGNLALLSGALCSWKGGSIASSTKRETFDGRGHVSYGSETIISGSVTDGYGNTTATYGGYTGNQYDPSSVGTYRIDGNVVTMQFGGETYTCTVHFRQQDGRITELMCGDQLWGTGLCE